MVLLRRLRDARGTVASEARAIHAHSAVSKTSKLEGMLTTQSVVAALGLALVVGLQGSIPQAEYDTAEFRFLLAAHPEFRAFAKAIWQQDGRNFSAQVDTDRFFDTRIILDDSSTARRIMGSGSREWEMGIEVTYNHMKGAFPLEKMRSYLAMNYHALSPSVAIVVCYTLGFASLSIALGTSVTMYASLLVAPIHEDAALVNRERGGMPDSEKAWIRFGMPCVMVNNLFWVAGAMAFTFGTSAVSFVRSPRAQSMWFAFVTQVGLTVPGSLIMGFLCPLVALLAATRASYLQRNERLEVLTAP